MSTQLIGQRLDQPGFQSCPAPPIITIGRPPEGESNEARSRLAGDLDAVLSARPPAPIVAGDARVRRLFADYREVESAYARKTGIFPIMHVIALRREIYEHDRWLAMNLFGMHAY